MEYNIWDTVLAAWKATSAETKWPVFDTSQAPFERSLTEKRSSMIAVVLTVVLLFANGLLSLFIQMVALNGASERLALAAMGISLACQGAVVIAAAVFARWLTQKLISRFNWNAIPSIAVAVVLGTFGGASLSFLSIMIAIPMAGIR